jgi:hypothetical protein
MGVISACAGWCRHQPCTDCWQRLPQAWKRSEADPARPRGIATTRDCGRSATPFLCVPFRSLRGSARRLRSVSRSLRSPLDRLSCPTGLAFVTLTPHRAPSVNRRTERLRIGVAEAELPRLGTRPIMLDTRHRTSICYRTSLCAPLRSPATYNFGRNKSACAEQFSFV